VVEWWSGGVVEWWSGGVVEWWFVIFLFLLLLLLLDPAAPLGLAR
jgi:hypothetical protein